MIGKSYDGTFANGVAATGVDGLTTIVPISAISDWYDYSRMGGIRREHPLPAQPGQQHHRDAVAATLGVLPPDHRTPCANVFTDWTRRRRRRRRHQPRSGTTATTTRTSARSRPPSSSRTASTTTTSARTRWPQWWAGLAANNVPRKLWLSLEGHVDPFDYRRTEWVDTLHRWFDYWLQGVQNGIMRRAARGHRDSPPDNVEDLRRLADPGHDDDRRLPQRPRRRPVRRARRSAPAAAPTRSRSRTTSLSRPTRSTSPNGSQANRLDVPDDRSSRATLHLSGTPIIDLQASLEHDAVATWRRCSSTTAPASQIGRGGSDGVSNTTTRAGRRPAGGDPTAGRQRVLHSRSPSPCRPSRQWRVTKGILDSSNRDSLFTARRARSRRARSTSSSSRILPTEYTFPAGHQIGVVLRGQLLDWASPTARRRPSITRRHEGQQGHRCRSRAATTRRTAARRASWPTRRPPVLGRAATSRSTTTRPDRHDRHLHAADRHRQRRTRRRRSPAPRPAARSSPSARRTVTCTATDANGNTSATKTFKVTVTGVTTANGDTSGTVPATLSLTLGAAGDVRRVHPRRHEGPTPRRRPPTSSRRPATRRSPSRRSTGHLVNGTFSLPSPLRGRRSRKATLAAPVSNDPVTLGFKPAHQLHRRAAHGRVQQDADVHAVSTNPYAVSAQAPTGGYPHPRWALTPTEHLGACLVVGGGWRA